MNRGLRELLLDTPLCLTATMRSHGGRHADLLEDVRRDSGDDKHLGPIQSQVNTSEYEVVRKSVIPLENPSNERPRHFPLCFQAGQLHVIHGLPCCYHHQRHRSVSGRRPVVGVVVLVSRNHPLLNLVRYRLFRPKFSCKNKCF